MLRISSFLSATTAFSISVLLSGTAFAQTAIPSTVDAGRIRTDITNEMQKNIISTPTDISTSPEVVAPVGAENVKMVLKSVVIEGATKLSKDQMASAYKNQLNKKITLADVYKIANKITMIYRDNGYLLSRAIVPKQQIRDGVVHIQVIEGHVSHYVIEGHDGGVRNQIRAYADRLVKTGTLNAQNLERYLLLMNDLPGVKVRSVLVPSKTEFGGTDLTLVVEQKKFQGSVGADNFGNKFLGPYRYTATGQANSLFNTTDQINAAVLLSPDSGELQFYSMNYSQNIGPEGTKAGLNATYAETNPTLPDAIGGLLDPQGKSYSVGASVTHPFIRSRAFNLSGGAAFDITKNQTNYEDPAFSSIETDDDQRIARLSAQANYVDNWAGYNAGDVTVSKGFSILGSSKKGDTNLSRFAGDPSFTKMNLSASRLQRIYGALTGLVAVTGQYSSNSLLSSEQFGFGGSQFGRGYDFSEITGDHGIAGKVELAYSIPTGQKYFSSYQPYAFYDMGKVWNRTPSAGLDSQESAGSIGAGTRMAITPTVQGDVFIAKPTNNDVSSRGDHGDDIRVKFSVSASF